MWHAGESILITLWVGSLWTVGYIVAPTLFATLNDRALAGQLAGQMFTIAANFGIVCGVLMVLIRKMRGARWADAVIALAFVTIALLAVGEWVVHPLATAAREAQSASFGRWHGVASLLWLAASVSGLCLVVVQSPSTRG